MEAGAAPPQESGLMFNSWSGKHHQEVTIPLTRRNTNLLQLSTRCLASIITECDTDHGTIAVASRLINPNDHSDCLRAQMRMWHQGWQPVWGRPHLLDRSWEWYLQNLESSQREAQRQVTIA